MPDAPAAAPLRCPEVDEEKFLVQLETFDRDVFLDPSLFPKIRKVLKVFHRGWWPMFQEPTELPPMLAWLLTTPPSG